MSDDDSPLPPATPELIETLRLAEAAADNEGDKSRYRLLRDALGQPVTPTSKQIYAQFAGEGHLNLHAGQSSGQAAAGEGRLHLRAGLADQATATDELTTVTVSRSTSWDTLESVASSRDDEWVVEAARQSIDYAASIAKWGVAGLAVAKVIHEASDIVLSWWTASGR